MRAAPAALAPPWFALVAPVMAFPDGFSSVPYVEAGYQLPVAERVIGVSHVASQHLLHEGRSIQPGKKMATDALLFLNRREGRVVARGVAKVRQGANECRLPGSRGAGDHVEMSKVQRFPLSLAATTVQRVNDALHEFNLPDGALDTLCTASTIQEAGAHAIHMMNDDRQDPPSMTAVNLSGKLSTFTDHWAPRVVAEFNGHDVMVVKVKGEFRWHQHDDTDDFFLVLSGRIRIRMEGGDVHLGPGELFVVPKGVQHCPVAEEEAHLLLIEPTGTPNTGDKATAATRTVV